MSQKLCFERFLWETSKIPPFVQLQLQIYHHSSPTNLSISASLSLHLIGIMLASSRDGENSLISFDTSPAERPMIPMHKRRKFPKDDAVDYLRELPLNHWRASVSSEAVPSTMSRSQNSVSKLSKTKNHLDLPRPELDFKEKKQTERPKTENDPKSPKRQSTSSTQRVPRLASSGGPLKKHRRKLQLR